MNYYYEAVLQTAKYIEDNLTADIEIRDIVDRVGFSQFHFMRIFKSISGHTINNYIKRRKITEAARTLLDTDMRIIDIAVLYGYGSQEAFTRTFKEIFNVTPNAYRLARCTYKNVEQIIMSEELLELKQISVKPIEPKIVYREDFMIAGIKYKGKNENYEIPKLWNRLREQYEDIKYYDTWYGLECYYEDSQKSGIFEYIAGVEVTNTAKIPSNFVLHKVNYSKYAVFPIKSIIENIPKSIGEIYSVHLPYSGLKAIGNYDFEYYDSNYEPNDHNSSISFYIPVE